MRDLSILLIDRANAHVFNPLLWSVAAGSAVATSVTVPLGTLQRGRSFHVLNAKVAAIDLEHQVVRTTAGDRNYDILVIALGSVTTVPDVPGVREHVHIFRRPPDAVQVRNYLIDAIERAHQSTESDERNAWHTFVVAGGGDTGCELAAAINEYVLRGLYRRLVAQPPRVVIVERADRLVPLSPPDVSTLLRAHLEAEGIEVWTGVSVEAVTNDAVHAGGSILPTHTVFWAAGVSAPEIVRSLPTRHEHNGALTVDASLRLPEYPNVYALGDNAWALYGVSGGTGSRITGLSAWLAWHAYYYICYISIRGATVPCSPATGSSRRSSVVRQASCRLYDDRSGARSEPIGQRAPR